MITSFSAEYHRRQRRARAMRRSVKTAHKTDRKRLVAQAPALRGELECLVARVVEAGLAGVALPVDVRAAVESAKLALGRAGSVHPLAVIVDDAARKESP